MHIGFKSFADLGLKVATHFARRLISAISIFSGLKMAHCLRLSGSGACGETPTCRPLKENLLDFVVASTELLHYDRYIHVCVCVGYLNTEENYHLRYTSRPIRNRRRLDSQALSSTVSAVLQASTTAHVEEKYCIYVCILAGSYERMD